jgi:hypothetical protein
MPTLISIKINLAPHNRGLPESWVIVLYAMPVLRFIHVLSAIELLGCHPAASRRWVDQGMCKVDQ